ncbi:MAG TPA: hypothetical protein VFH73_22110 [Polyangia bacterium]|jgi:hypothetical protein|nr:hypothetical protein [Polyangia bacterium]
MKTTTLSALFIVSAFTFTSALASAKDTDHRGELVVKGESVKAFAAGPSTVRLYSMDHGGKVFTAPATTGTDADCLAARKAAGDRQQPVQMDRRNVLEVAAGDVACLATTSPRSFELLWHARVSTTPAKQTLVAQKN